MDIRAILTCRKEFLFMADDGNQQPAEREVIREVDKPQRRSPWGLIIALIVIVVLLLLIF